MPVEFVLPAQMISPTYGYMMSRYKDRTKGFGVLRFGKADVRGSLNAVHGHVFERNDTSCTPPFTGNPMQSQVLRVTPGDYYGMSDSEGNYSIVAQQGLSFVEQLFPKEIGRLTFQNCPKAGNAHMVQFDSLRQDSAGFDFSNKVIECQALQVDLSSNRRRRCFKNKTKIAYCNRGFASAPNAKVFVEMPEYVSLIIGVDSVQCINGIMGLTQCTKVRISPNNACLDSLDPASTSGDKSFVKLHQPVCVGDSIHFLIENTGLSGLGDMAAPSEYRIYTDNLLVYTGTFQLDGGGSITIKVPANGQTFRLEADQRTGLGGKFRPSVFIEGCGNGGQPLSFGEPNKAPQDDENFIEEIDCLPIIDSYDPNDKQVAPSGITADRYVKPGTTLDYKIRFQNTGSDTAYKVIIVDTLSENLDISSLQIGASSHDFTFDVTGKVTPVLIFTFDDIYLPDSTTDEPNSNGFVKFKIEHKPNLPNGTRIGNSADIYFDFNLPIRTNDSWITIHHTVIQGSPIQVNELPTSLIPLPEKTLALTVAPNPFRDEFTVSWPEEPHTRSMDLKLYDAMGRCVLGYKVTQEKSFTVPTKDLSPAIYYLELNSQKGMRGKAKLIKYF
jgi:uncharacterized repeat protein (TIGR01451 family)